MAKFARLNDNNEVVEILELDNSRIVGIGGIEVEQTGIDILEAEQGTEGWKQCNFCSRGGVHYNCDGVTGPDLDSPSGQPAFRANYPALGWFYSEDYDIFYEPQPEDRYGRICTSWSLSTTTGYWVPPTAKPTVIDDGSDNEFYVWDEPTRAWINIYA